MEDGQATPISYLQSPISRFESMITEEYMIKPLNPGRTAIQVAAECYRDWLPQVSFEDDLAHYLAYGVMISTPTCFALLKMIEDLEDPKKGPAWFIRMAVGRLDELLYHLPYHFPRIYWCRGKKGDLRIRSYSLKRFMQLTGGKAYGRWRSR
jgi:hypothetical protein